jgi:predicted Zn-dependent peptidase
MGQWDYDILSGMKWQHKEQGLKNGLSLVTVPMKTDSVSAVLMVRAGSRDEAKKINGISHFLEHMVFKATKKWPSAMAMNQVIDSVGGAYNAYTSREYTSFWVKVAKEHLKLSLEFLYQAVFQPLLPANELERERGVILEEIKMYEDNPMQKVARSFLSQVYGLTCLGQDVIGPAENIKRLKRQEFYDYLKTWYQPKNMVLAIAGGVGEGVEKMIEEIFVGLDKSKIGFKDKPKRLSFSQLKPVVQVVNKDIQQAHFCLGVRGLEKTNKDRYALGVLNTILGGSTSSRLWNEVREKRGLVYYVRSGAYGFFETGYLMTQAGCDVNKIEEAIKVVLGEYMKLVEKPVLAKELKLAKEYLKGRLALGLEDSQAVAGEFGESWLLEGKVRTVEEIKQGVEAVRLADIQRVAKQIFEKKGLNLTVVGPFKAKDKFNKLLV